LLDEYFARSGRKLDMVLDLHVDQDQLIKRLLKRAELEDRGDDDHETIKARLRVFETQTAPLLDYYRKRGLLTTIKGMQSPEDVFEDIRAAVAAQA